MKREELLRYIGSVDDKYIEELFTDSVNAVKNRRKKHGWAVLAACMALAMLGGFAVFNNRAADEVVIDNKADNKADNYVAPITSKNTVIMLDVNPSVSIEVNDDGVVVEVSAENKDADEILSELKLDGKKYEDAILKAVKVFNQHDYISPLKNSLLITVLNDNDKTSECIREKAVNAIINNESKYEVSVLSQIMTDERAYKKTASEYGVSSGRMLLIDKTNKMNPNFPIDKLAAQTIHTLNQLYAYTGLPKLVHRAGTAAGTVPGEYIGQINTSDLSEKDLISFIKNISDFYDEWNSSHDLSDADNRVGNAYKAASSKTSDAREICNIVVESLKALEQNNNSSSGSKNNNKITADDVGKLADAVISIVEFFD